MAQTFTRFPFKIINSTLGIKLKFQVNPNNIKFASQKVYSETRTLGGWVFEHWGDRPDVMTVNGITKAMHQDDAKDIEQAFYKLRSIYKLDQRELSSILPGLKSFQDTAQDAIRGTLKAYDLVGLGTTLISYKHNIYTGFFTRFDWSMEGERPFIYPYSFEFLVTATAEDYIRDQAFSPIVTGLAVGGDKWLKKKK